jgi:hypothetical protein
VHDALFFSSTDELAAATVPFVREGLAAGDAVVVAASPATADVVRAAVDGDERVRVLEQGETYARRAPATVTTFRRLTDELTATGAPRVRVVGETDFGRSEREWLEWLRYEAVLNDALAPWPLWGLCVFDTTRLPEPVLESVARTHATVVAGRSRTPNPRFVDPAEYLSGLPVPREPLQSGAPRLAVDDVADPIALRHAVAAELAAVGGPREVVEDFLLAVTRRPPTPSGTARHRWDCGCGRRPSGSCAPSPTTGRAWTTRSPATARPTATTSPAAAWACGWPASCATTSTSAPARTASRSG